MENKGRSKGKALTWGPRSAKGRGARRSRTRWPGGAKARVGGESTGEGRQRFPGPQRRQGGPWMWVTQESQGTSKSTSGKARGDGLGRDGVGQRGELLPSVWPRKEGDRGRGKKVSV